MNIEIRKLTPDLAEDYVTFFDTTPHNERYKIKCYCVFWCNDDSEGKNFSSKKARRDYAIQCVKGNNMQGYWMNAFMLREMSKTYFGGYIFSPSNNCI